MRKEMVLAAILSLSGCATTHEQLTERAQLTRSASVATTNTACAYVGDQLNCRSYVNKITPAEVER
jgi:uncharacterized lipoprotein YmbA